MGFSASALVLSLLLLVLGFFALAYGATALGPALVFVGLIGIGVCVAQGMHEGSPAAVAEAPRPAPVEERSIGVAGNGASLPQRSREERLQELLDLQAKGLIDDGDLHARRYAILEEV